MFEGSRVTVDDILGGRDGAGNWKAAFHVDIEDTKALGGEFYESNVVF